MTARSRRPADPSAVEEGSGDADETAGHRLSHREKGLERKRLDALTATLIGLRPHELDHLQLEDELRDAVDELKALSGSARGRQARYVHGMLRELDLDALERRVRLGPGSSYAPASESKKSPAELWVERLLVEGDPAVDLLVEAHAEADRQQLRQLIRTARRTPPSKASRRAHRSLCATLEALLEDR